MDRPTPKAKAVTLFRILICTVAVLALTGAITYMIRDVILELNDTNRLLANAFMGAMPQETEPALTEEKETATQPPQKVAIVDADLSVSRPTITNYTAYSIDEKELAERKLAYYSYGTSPLVLILHSHPDEGYAPAGAGWVPADYPFVDRDPQNNVFAVGEVISDLLTTTGIGNIHVSEMIEDPKKTIETYLRQYPSIQFVLDLHRDGLYTEDGRIVATKGELNSERAAQLMLAVGTGDAAEGFDFRGNLAAAYTLAAQMTEAEPQIMRPILLRPEGLHQQYAPCSLSLYVGTTGNTLADALTSARFFARYFAIFILNARSYG